MLDENWPRIAEVPFTSERKRMTTVHKMAVEVQQTDLPWRDNPYVLLSKGAVGSLLKVTNRILVDNEFVDLDDRWRERILRTRNCWRSKACSWAWWP
jgi:Ca2+-transporting ATPase